MTNVNIAMLESALIVSAWGLAWGFLCSAVLYGTVPLLRRFTSEEGEDVLEP